MPTRPCASSSSARWRAPRASAAWRAARCSISPPKAASACRSTARPTCEMLQAMKTGALLRFGCEAGGILAARHARAARRARTLRLGGRRSVPDRRRSLGRRRRFGAGRQTDRQGCGGRQGDLRQRARHPRRQGAAGAARCRRRKCARDIWTRRGDTYRGCANSSPTGARDPDTYAICAMCFARVMCLRVHAFCACASPTGLSRYVAAP